MLTAIIPRILRHLRPLYKRKQLVGLAEVDSSPDSHGDTSGSNLGNGVLETSDRLDVHITIGSWFIESLAYIAVATTTTLTSQLAGLSYIHIHLLSILRKQLITAVVCIGFGAGRVPVFRSVVSATVDPLKQG